jgi:hypothetical protein
VCRLSRKQVKKKIYIKKIYQKLLLRQTSHLHVIWKVLICRALEASYLEDVSIVEGTRRVEEAEPKEVVIL